MLQSAHKAQSFRHENSSNTQPDNQSKSLQSTDQQVSVLISSQSHQNAFRQTLQFNRSSPYHCSVVFVTSMTLLCLLATLIVTYQLHSSVTERSQEIKELKSSNQRMMMELQQLKSTMKLRNKAEKQTSGDEKPSSTQEKEQGNAVSVSDLALRLEETQSILQVLVRKLIVEKDFDIKSWREYLSSITGSELKDLLHKISHVEKLRNSDGDHYTTQSISYEKGQFKNLLQYVGDHHSVNHICKYVMTSPSQYRVKLLTMTSVNFLWGVGTSALSETGFGSPFFLSYNLFENYVGMYGKQSVFFDKKVGTRNSTLHLNYDPKSLKVSWEIDGQLMYETMIPEEIWQDALHFVVYFEHKGDRIEIVKQK